MRFAALLVAVITVVLPVVGTAPAQELPPFPNLELRSMDDGRTTTLDSYRGKPVLITFWASWCGPCRLEMPELQRIYDELADDGFVVLAVNMDRAPGAGRAFLDRMNLSLPAYTVDPGVLRALGVQSIPTSVLIGVDGIPEQVYEGYSPVVPEDIERRVREILSDEARS